MKPGAASPFWEHHLPVGYHLSGSITCLWGIALLGKDLQRAGEQRCSPIAQEPLAAQESGAQGCGFAVAIKERGGRSGAWP